MSRQAKQPLDERFRTFHEQHPEVYATLVRLTREWKQRGRKKLGIGMVWERMRWEMAMETQDPSGYKLNNDYRSRYARLIMQQEPDLQGVFETRELRSEVMR
jgi:hypothetical protein